MSEDGTAGSGGAGARIRVLIADDHPVFRDGLATLLEPHPDIEVVARAADGAEAVALAAEHRPDVVVMDIQMPEVNGIEATRRVLAADPSIGVLVFTMGEDDGTLLSAMRAGARGYLVKGASQEEVTRAITAVHAGGVVFGASLASRIGELLSPSPARTATEFPMLTEREREVLDLIAAGRSNAQIAAELFLAPKTVRNNVSAILSKLQATDRAEVIIRARDAGLGQRG
ncbi:response regulator transcription factor [Phycicoccus sp. M110.8]|uniref:response regulator transcription factor n=1 Tax=Phycicoccus sp. M110.8 TaxID=3075433 RepID=UPI0028FCFCA9|nr:response regulator transcription factor [Phycicoccus sp. M110.8]MDU0313038.1 response regulator transcription factor [Phycicoccus sp. M110.8]HET8768380.1 response regulator transcription factor [Pedococcus sp.]